MRCGASSNTQARASAPICCTSRWRSAALGERKPANTKRPFQPPAWWVKPATLSSAVMLLAPGIGTQRSPAAVTAAASRAPGSLTPGVPASLT
ncbi:hypothetical protein FQZ97_719150 [compost metagenome]